MDDHCDDLSETIELIETLKCSAIKINNIINEQTKIANNMDDELYEILLYTEKIDNEYHALNKIKKNDINNERKCSLFPLFSCILQ